MQATIRYIREEDIPAVLEVYRPYVEETSISWEEETPSLEAFTERVRGIRERYPYLVCECDGRIAGFAYASEFNPRAAYRYSAAVSVYLDPAYHRRGIGTALYEVLFALLREMGVCTVYAGVTTDNEPSRRMHFRLGFADAGTYRRCGYKFGRWHDVSWMDKRLQEPETPREQLLRPDELDLEELSRRSKAARMLT